MSFQLATFLKKWGQAYLIRPTPSLLKLISRMLVTTFKQAMQASDSSGMTTNRSFPMSFWVTDSHLTRQPIALQAPHSISLNFTPV